MSQCTLTEQFAMIALDGQDALHMTVAKRMALRSIAAAVVLELQMPRGLASDAVFTALPEDTDLTLYQQTALLLLAPQQEEGVFSLVKRAERLNDKALKKLERTITDSLMCKSLMDTVQDLLACDMYYDVQNMDLQQYRAESHEFSRLSEGLRAEILEDDQMADENVIMFWLLRESGCVHDFFSSAEMPTVDVQMQKAYQVNRLAKGLMMLEIHKRGEGVWKSFLSYKKRAAKCDYGIGFNFVFPMFERSQTVFIDMEKLFEENEKYLSIILERLSKHEIEVLRAGKVPLLRIDNALYEAIPAAVPVGGVGLRVPVYGARLRRYPLFG